MLASELTSRLERLLAGKLPPAAARAKAGEITRQIARLHQVAASATRVARGSSRLSGVGPGCPGTLADHCLGAVNTQAVGTAAAGAKAGAAAGSAIMPVVGTVIGAAVGAVVGYLIGHKQYLNVNDANSTEDQDALDIWPQYRKIAGTVAGRDIGLPLLERAWRGAVYTGADFPLNNAKKCFHNGCLKYPGNPDWIHAAIYGFGGGVGNNFTFPAALQQVGATADPHVVAQQFVANNQSDAPAWAVPRTPTGQQLLVDIADALVAQKGAPYTYAAPATQPAGLAQPIGSPAPTQPLAPGVVSGVTSVGQQPVPMIATTPDTTTAQLLQQLLAQQGVQMNSPGAQQLVGSVAATGVQHAGLDLSSLPTWAPIAAAFAALAFATARPAPSYRRRRR